jgi:hypothetical protein
MDEAIFQVGRLRGILDQDWIGYAWHARRRWARLPEDYQRRPSTARLANEPSAVPPLRRRNPDPSNIYGCRCCSNVHGQAIVALSVNSDFLFQLLLSILAGDAYMIVMSLGLSRNRERECLVGHVV